MSYDYKLSFVVLGEMGVGKSSLLLRFAQNVFREHLASTIIDCFHTDLRVQNTRVRLELWDTAGQERFKCVMENYYRKADGVLLVYDVTDVSSFHKLSSWFLKLKSENEDAVSTIVGNKIDHPQGKAVAVSTVKKFAEEQNLVFYESSAKTGENVIKIFKDLATRVLEAKGIDPSKESQTKSKQNSKTLYQYPIVPSIMAAPSNTSSSEPPKEVVKLHKTVTPVIKKKSCC